MTINKIQNLNKKTDNQKILDQIYSSREFRKELADNDMFWFFSIYFARYIQYKTAKIMSKQMSRRARSKSLLDCPDQREGKRSAEFRQIIHTRI